ncbi:hypothetical protein ACE2AJ_11970 [Aquihabitans daechungensis]|uniref:hypothetical protein n=1 Tax=Aquihabitans daechungensis TaxID=1052257 RepID=UPI003BA0F82F
MDRPIPPPEDDQLLERLRALGPVLDDLTREAEDAGGLDADGTGRRGQDRRRRPADRRRTLAAAAAVVLIIAGAIGIVAVVADEGETVRTDQPATTTTTESAAALEARVAERIDGVERCGPLPTREQVPVPWPAGWEMVGSPECATAYVEDPSTTKPVPVYLEPEITTPIAFWSEATGWIDATEYRDPAFDLERYRAAYQAGLEARDDAGN